MIYYEDNTIKRIVPSADINAYEQFFEILKDKITREYIMARPKTKESTYINCKIDNKCYDALTQYCEKTGLSKTVAIEHALNYSPLKW